VTGIGIVIPLDASTTIDLSTVDQRAGPAMLFSIRKMRFENKRNQTARFQMQQMVLQFVDMYVLDPTEVELMKDSIKAIQCISGATIILRIIG
jgi:hypothetical protein